MRHFLMTAVLVGLWTTRVAAAEQSAEIDRLLQQIGEKVSDYKTWTADYSQTMNMMGSPMTVSGQVQYRLPREMRMELSMPLPDKPGAMTVVMDRDGVMWQDTNMGGLRRVTKFRLAEALGESGGAMGPGADPSKEMNPREQLKQMQALYDLTMLPVADLHEQPMHVLEGTWKESALTNRQIQAASQMIDKTRFYIGQKDGFIHKIQMFGKTGDAPLMTQEFQNLKLNVELADEVFQFTPPEGVEVVDLTEMMKQMHGGKAAAPPRAHPPVAPPPAAPPAGPPAAPAPAAPAPAAPPPPVPAAPAQ